MTNADAYEAGVDAVIADNGLNQNGFETAVRTVATSITAPEADAWVTAIYTEYERLGIINNPTYSSLRNSIINDGKTAVMNLFEALSGTINGMDETIPVNQDLKKIGLRAERDEVSTSITTMQAFKTGATRQVKDALQLGIEQLRGHKEAVRDQLRSLNDPNP